ncbi:MAG: tetratricopeptide repeat protein [Candidatus Omnitrophica bacterium]|nr:tetratricopeptide repeat protein [Candidatus Omnitrophota bacterium]
MNKKIILFSCVLICALGLLAYANSLKGEFVWDDTNLIEKNVYVKDFKHIPKLFTKDISSSAKQGSGFFRPLQMFTYMLDFKLWRLNPIGYHLINVLLHILSALCVFWFIMMLYDDHILSILTGLLFLLHPLHTEAVSYISGRSDPLALLFMLLAFIYYIKYLKIKNILSLLLMLIAYILALLSREITLILPLLLLIYHYIFKEKLKSGPFFSILGIAFVYIIIRATLLRSILAQAAETTFFQRLPGFFVAITTYIRLLFLPFGLHMEYGNQTFSWAAPKAIFGLFIFVLSLVYILRDRERRDIYKFSLLWFFVALLPVSNLYPLNAYMAEHWLYIPSIGFCLLLARPLTTLYDKKRNFVIISSILILVCYTFITVNQNDYWREPISFYQRTLCYAPDSARVYSELGLAYDDIGKPDKAIPAYKKAIEIDPGYERPHTYLGLAYRESGREKESLAAFKKAIELDPRRADVHINLGNLYVSLKQYKAAIGEYQKAIELNPDIAESHYDSGVAYEAMGEYQKASEYYREAIELDHTYMKAYFNLGNVNFLNKKYEQAIDFYKKALQLDSGFAEGYGNLAVAYYRTKNYDLAVQAYKKAKELGSNNPTLDEILKPYIKDE